MNKIKNYYLPGIYPADFLNDRNDKKCFLGFSGNEYITNDFKKYPHILISGATGSGKSTILKTLIVSMISTYFFDEIQFIFIDLKRVELAFFESLPHCLGYYTDIENVQKTLLKLIDLINVRYQKMKNNGITNLNENESLFSRVFVVIDEYAELVLSGQNIEKLIIKISQIGRAAGVHLILCTQLPTAKILTNLINVNMSCKIALRVETAYNSRSIINQNGAELLNLNGDALIKQGPFLKRFQAFQTPSEDLKTIVDY